MQNFPKKVLVVDDDSFHLEIMRHLLSGEGIEDITCVENGVACLDEVYHNPDAVFLDLHMEVYTGFETLRKIKRYNPNIFVVMVSAQEDIDTAVASLKYGAFDYIRKNDQLERNVKSALLAMGQMQELLKARKSSFLKRIFQFL